jgi:hypothetical protein
MNDNNLLENCNISNWSDHIECIRRLTISFSRSVERQKQIDELVRNGLDHDLALAVVDL